MKKYISIITLLTVSLLLIAGFRPAIQEKQCLTYLKEYADKMAEIKFPKEGRVYFMDVEMIGVSSLEESFKTRTKSYLTDKSVVLETDKMSSYMDTDDTFIVDHINRTVYRNKGSDKFSDYNSEIADMSKIQKEFLDNAVVRTCKDVEYNGKTVKFIYLNISNEAAEVTKIRNIAYYFNTKSSLIEKMIIYFDKGQPLKKQTIINNKTDFNYKGYKILPVKNKVLSSGEKLLPAFAGYQLIDNR